MGLNTHRDHRESQDACYNNKTKEQNLISTIYGNSKQPKSSTCCVNENHSFYVYRADTNQVLARGLDGFEAAKSRANQIRQQHNLKWNQVKFKMEPNQKSTGSVETSNVNKINQSGYYDRSKVYNPSKR